MFRQRPKEIKDCLLENDRFHVSGESFITNGPDDFAAHAGEKLCGSFR